MNGKPPKTIDGHSYRDSDTSLHVDNLRGNGDFNPVYPSNEMANLWRLNDAIGRGSNDARTLLLEYCQQNGLPIHRIIGYDKVLHGFEVRMFHKQMNDIYEWCKWLKKTAEGFTDPLTFNQREIVQLHGLARIVLSLSDDEESHSIHYECNSVIDAVRLWLIYRTCSKNAKIGICKNCFTPFLQNRATDQHCDNCNNSTVRMQELRKRKKQKAQSQIE